MSFRMKQWRAYIGSVGMGWNLRRGPGSAHLVHFTVTLFDAPETHQGRGVYVEMDPARAETFIADLTRAVAQARRQDEIHRATTGGV